MGHKGGDSRHRCIRRLCSLSHYIHLRISTLNNSPNISSNTHNNILSNIHNILNNIPMCSL